MSDLAVAVALDQEGTAPSARQALEALYGSHRESVFRYLRAILRDDDEALDLTATTFERAFAELRKGRELGLGWLLRTARNAAIDRERRSRTTRLFLRRSPRLPAIAPSAEDLTLEAERSQRVRLAVAALPRPQRDAIAIRYTSELSVREIARVIGKSPDATQKLLDRGLARLKESLDERA